MFYSQVKHKNKLLSHGDTEKSKAWGFTAWKKVLSAFIRVHLWQKQVYIF